MMPTPVEGSEPRAEPTRPPAGGGAGPPSSFDLPRSEAPSRCQASGTIGAFPYGLPPRGQDPETRSVLLPLNSGHPRTFARGIGGIGRWKREPLPTEREEDDGPTRPSDTRRSGRVRRRPRLLLRPRARPSRRNRRPERPLRRRVFPALDRGAGPEGRGGGDRDRVGSGPRARGSYGGEPRERGPTGPRAARRRERLRAAF